MCCGQARVISLNLTEFDACEETIAVPTYAYRCIKCGKVFERQEHVADHDRSRPRCPKCHSSKVQSVPTSFYVKTSKKT